MFCHFHDVINEDIYLSTVMGDGKEPKEGTKSPTISITSESRLHTGARVNFVLLTYSLIILMVCFELGTEYWYRRRVSFGYREGSSEFPRDGKLSSTWSPGECTDDDIMHSHLLYPLLPTLDWSSLCSQSLPRKGYQFTSQALRVLTRVLISLPLVKVFHFCL